MSGALLVALVGATATGKTDLGEALAERIGGEVVCADSRQVFRELEIGTGKPDARTRASRPHHLFEALSVGEPASAGWYARALARVCDEIRGRGRVPVLVGGSGLYLRAAREGLAPTPPADASARAGLLEAWDRDGGASLLARLRSVDPETAARLDPADRQRIVRALEVMEASGRPLSWWHRQPRTGALPGRWRVVELTHAVSELRSRIERRARWMFGNGILEEAAALRAAGREGALRRLRAVGYDEALDAVAGALSREDAERRTVQRTVQLAKRQRTWFRHQVEAARLDAAFPAGTLLERVTAAVG